MMVVTGFQNLNLAVFLNDAILITLCKIDPKMDNMDRVFIWMTNHE